MAKKKKTREQKIMAEVNRRNQLSAQYKYTFTPSAVTSEIKARNNKITELKPQVKNSQHTTNTNNYLIYDLRKTILVTIIILSLQVFLRVFIK